MTKVLALARGAGISNQYTDTCLPTKINELTINGATIAQKAGKGRKCMIAHWKKVMHKYPGLTMGKVDVMKLFGKKLMLLYTCQYQ